MSPRFRRRLLICAVLLLGFTVVSYVGDYAFLRYRIARQKNPFGQVTINTYYASALKNGRMEYDFQPPQDVTCVNALYPHMDMQPCWYLSRHREKRVDVM